MIDSNTTTNSPPTSTHPTLEGRWKERINSWSLSGLSKSAYCKSAGVDYHQMIYWSRKLAVKAKTPDQDNPPASKKRAGFVTVSVVPATATLFIRLPNGIEVGGIQEQRLTHIIDLVSR